MDEITVPVATLSQNTYTNYHWSKKRRSRQEYELLIRNQMRLNKVKTAEPGEEFEISIVTYRKYPIRDHANLVGGAKGFIDALVNERFIWDDAEKYIGRPEIRQVQSSEEKTIVRRWSR